MIIIIHNISKLVITSIQKKNIYDNNYLAYTGNLRKNKNKIHHDSKHGHISAGNNTYGKN